MITPYYQDSTVTLYCGDMRGVLPEFGQFDACVTDPPYGETSLAWDHWVDGWPALVAGHTSSMWCFGSMRMFLDRRDEFTGWRLSQDVVWEKHNGSGFHTDRFRRVHEHAVYWYRGDWASVHRQVPVTMDATARQVRRKQKPAHTRHVHDSEYVSVDGGPRLRTSVIVLGAGMTEVDWRTQSVWDAIWDRFYAAALCRLHNPNQAIAEADQRMVDHKHGPRPQAEEAK